MIAWGTNQFTPMLLLYRARLGLSAAEVEAVFAMYAIGLVPGLLAGGSLADRIGRRPMLIGALLLSMAGSAVLVAGTRGSGWLFAGRLIVGLGSGSAFSASAAWIKELSAPPFGTGSPAAAARRISASITVGFALGPLVAGALAQWAPMPSVLPYLPQLVLAGVAIAVAARTPETVRSGGGSRWWQLRIGGLAEPRFRRVVLPAAPWVFGSVAVGFVYVPGLVASRAPGLAIAFAAAAAVAAAAGGVAIQPIARRLADRDEPRRPRLLITGLALIGVSLLAEAGIVAAASLGGWQPVLALPAAAGLGSGYGITLTSGLTEVARLARPADLAGVTGVFQVACYTGFAVPYLLSLLHGTASAPVLLLCLAALAGLTLAVTAWQARRMPGATRRNLPVVT